MLVDTILYNGVIRPDAFSAPVDTMALTHGRVLALGTDCEGLRSQQRVDLHGAVVVPGLHDAHTHQVWYGMSLDEVDLSSPPLRHVEEIYRAVSERARSQPAGTWIIGNGYDQNKLAGGHPERAALDRAAPGHLVWVKHASGHMGVVNSAVLAQLDLGAVPPGGDVVRAEDGRPTGLLREQAQLLLRPLLYPVPVDVLTRAIGVAGAHFLSEGITSVQEAGVGGGLVGRSPVEIAAYQRARADGLLRVRTTLMITAETLHEVAAHPADDGDLGLDLGMHTGLGDDWLRLGPVKIFADGSLIGRTAAMFTDYADEPGNRGYFQVEPDALTHLISRIHRAGWQVATHAIGDRAVSAVLDSYASALAAHPRRDHRHRIEHCGVITDADVDRMAALGVIPVPQGRFVNEIGDGMLAALGPSRIDGCYRQRSFLDAGITLPASSDRPVVNGAALLGLQDLVQRRTASGLVLSPHERLTPAQALHAYTWGSAYAAFAEHRVGTLAPGRLADLVVLPADPLDADALAGLGVLATMIDCDIAYDPTGLFG